MKILSGILSLTLILQAPVRRSKVLCSVFCDDVMSIHLCMRRAEQSSCSGSVSPMLPVLENGTLGVDIFVHFYHVITLFGIFYSILSLIMFLNPRTYCANGKIIGRNKNLFYEAVTLFSFRSSKDCNCQDLKIWRICDI